MDAKTLLVLIAFLATLRLVENVDSMTVHKLICTVHDNATIQGIKCFSKSVNRTLKLATVELFLQKPLAVIHVNSILYKKTLITYQPFLVNVTDDFCEYIGNNRGGIYLRSIAKFILPYSNINHPCPLSGLIYVRNLSTGMDSFLSIWPKGEYRLDLRISDGYKLILEVQAFVEFK